MARVPPPPPHLLSVCAPLRLYRRRRVHRVKRGRRGVVAVAGTAIGEGDG